MRPAPQLSGRLRARSWDCSMQTREESAEIIAALQSSKLRRRSLPVVNVERLEVDAVGFGHEATRDLLLRVGSRALGGMFSDFAQFHVHRAVIMTFAPELFEHLASSVAEATCSSARSECCAGAKLSDASFYDMPHKYEDVLQKLQVAGVLRVSDDTPVEWFALLSVMYSRPGAMRLTPAAVRGLLRLARKYNVGTVLAALDNVVSPAYDASVLRSTSGESSMGGRQCSAESSHFNPHCSSNYDSYCTQFGSSEVNEASVPDAGDWVTVKMRLLQPQLSPMHNDTRRTVARSICGRRADRAAFWLTSSGGLYLLQVVWLGGFGLSFPALCGVFPRAFIATALLMAPQALVVFMVLSLDLLEVLAGQFEVFYLGFLECVVLVCAFLLLQDERCLFWIAYAPSLLIAPLMDCFLNKYCAAATKRFFMVNILVLVSWQLAIVFSWCEPVEHLHWRFHAIRGHLTSSSCSSTMPLIIFSWRNVWNAIQNPQSFVTLKSAMMHSTPVYQQHVDKQSDCVNIDTAVRIIVRRNCQDA